MAGCETNNIINAREVGITLFKEIADEEKNIDKQRRALRLHPDDMGFRTIGRVLGVSHVTVLNWIHQAGHWIQAHHQRQVRPERAETTALGKMWHVIEPKK